MKDVFGKEIQVKEKRLFLFDMDGTVYLENRLFDGVKALFNAILAAGGRYVFITNNSSKSVDGYVQKMRGMGVDVTSEHFYTSSQAACDLLKPMFGKKLIYAQGTEAFVRQLREGGLRVTCHYDETAAAVLVGYDTELTYQKLSTTCKMLTECELPYYATNPDWVCPTEFGYAPDCGSMCFGIEKATKKTPTYIGKPQPTMIHTVMQKFGCTAAQTLVLGDRIYTDVAAGVAAGVDTVCVLSGETTLDDVTNSTVKPTYTIPAAADLTPLL